MLQHVYVRVVDDLAIPGPQFGGYNPAVLLEIGRDIDCNIFIGARDLHFVLRN
jgi:hypothetical protein